MSLFLFTFNCAKTKQLEFEKLAPVLPPTPPKILVFGFQELVPILESTIPNKVNQELLSINDCIHSVLTEKYTDVIHTVEIHHMGGIGIILMSSTPSEFKSIKTGYASCGLLYSSLKGGVGLRFKFKDQEYTVVVAHLSANEGQVARRNQDSWRLLQSIEFNDGWSVLKPGVHTFFMGDLNYRKAIYGDELVKQLDDGEAFPGFDEQVVDFEPTYKFIPGSLRYNDKRISSWCDRILYLKYDSGLKEVKYDSIPFLTSDHIPVYLSMDIPKFKPIDVIDSKGYLINSDINLKSTWDTKLNNYLMIFSDSSIGIGFKLIKTTGGNLILVLLILGLLYLLF